MLVLAAGAVSAGGGGARGAGRRGEGKLAHPALGAGIGCGCVCMLVLAAGTVSAGGGGARGAGRRGEGKLARLTCLARRQRVRNVVAVLPRRTSLTCVIVGPLVGPGPAIHHVHHVVAFRSCARRFTYILWSNVGTVGRVD